VVDRAKKGDRAALAVCVQRLIPGFKPIPELLVEQSREGPHSVEIYFIRSCIGAESIGEMWRPQLAVLDEDI
jgi:hypothetical protein